MNGLDVPSQEVITQVMADEVALGRTVIVSTHDIGAAVGSDLVVLVATRLIAAEPPSSVLAPERLLAAYGRQLAGVIDPSALGTAALGTEVRP